MSRLISITLGILLLSSSVYAESIKPTIKILEDVPVSGDDSKHGVTIMVDWPADAETPEHTHPGDEYAVVLEGEIEVVTKDKGSHIYKTGEAYYNAKGVVHASRAASGKPAKTIATLIVEKGKPLSLPVNVD